MKLRPLEIAGAYRIDLEPVYDPRGSFARTFDAVFMREHGLVDYFGVEAIATNESSGTIRGLHFQFAPYAQTKIVRALHGTIFDAILDVRPDSPTFGKSVCVELAATNGAAVYIPAGCAHGYQTSGDRVIAWYAIAGDYLPEHAGGIRYDDPRCNIGWPLPVTVVSAADRNLSSFDDFAAQLVRQISGEALPAAPPS
jgi:dTDP-4-dehydrorhamnose 3,5-epimerase